MTIFPVFVSCGLLLASLGWPVRHQPTSALARAEQLRHDNKFQEAIEAYTEAVRLDPHNYKAYLGRAGVYGASKQPQLANEDFDRAVQAAPTSDDPLFARAVNRYFDDRYAEAISDLDAAVRLNPGRFELYHWRACAHAALSHYEMALADYTQVIERDPAKTAYDGLDFVNRAATEMQLGRAEAALADYDKAAAVGGGNPLQRAGCLLELKRYREALAVFDELLHPSADGSEQDDDYNLALFNRALARTGLKDFRRAKEDLLAYTAGRPNDARTYGNVSWALLLANQPAEARVAALQGLALDDTQTWIHINLADALLVEGKVDQAKAIYLEEKGKSVEGKTGAQTARDDFNDLRAAGIDVPGMQVVEALLLKLPDALPGSNPPLKLPPIAVTLSAATPEAAPSPAPAAH